MAIFWFGDVMYNNCARIFRQGATSSELINQPGVAQLDE